MSAFPSFEDDVIKANENNRILMSRNLYVCSVLACSMTDIGMYLKAVHRLRSQGDTNVPHYIFSCCQESIVLQKYFFLKRAQFTQSRDTRASSDYVADAL